MRINIPANSPFDDILGFSRVVAIGPHAWVSATAPYDENNSIIGVDDGYLQTKQCLNNIESALGKANFDTSNIVRTRIYLRSFAYKDSVLRAHHEIFRNIKPACGVIAVADFVHPDMLVYIEADAYKF